MKKKQIGMIVSVAVIAVAAIGFTLAFLHSITETKTNTFSSNKNISIQLREPAWDGYGFDSETDPDGGTANPDHSGTTPLGVIEAQRYVPGQTIDKDPTVKNNGDKVNGVPAYVAIKVQYYTGTGENEKQVSYNGFKAAFLDAEGIEFSNQWSDITPNNSNDQIYLYGTETDGATALAVDGTTVSLFTEVPISLDLEPDAETGKLPGFNIKVQAYAIQTTGVDNAAEALLTFIGKN